MVIGPVPASKCFVSTNISGTTRLGVSVHPLLLEHDRFEAVLEIILLHYLLICLDIIALFISVTSMHEIQVY